MLGESRHRRESGHLRTAIDLLWFAIGLRGPREEQKAEACALVGKWLTGVSWQPQVSQERKLHFADLFLREIAGMAEL